MAESGFTDYVLDQLRPWAPVAARRMFSAQGLYRAGTMFALVRAETLYFRTDDSNVADFTAAGMAPFQYNRAGVTRALGYHEVPADVLDESDLLARWAERAYAVALRRAAECSKPRRRKPATRRRASA
jgi:DNA transformation protein and related proteins